MKAFWQKNDRSVLSLLIIGLAVFFVLASYRGVEATTLYIIPDNANDISDATGPAGMTNLPSFNTSRLGTNDYYNTYFSTTAPTDSNTRMREQYTANGSWYPLGKVYFNPALESNATILANATGKFYLVSERADDTFKFQLRDYDPSGGSADGTLISESPEYTGARTTPQRLRHLLWLSEMPNMP